MVSKIALEKIFALVDLHTFGFLPFDSISESQIGVG
jgi:hypothetical protein